MQPINLVIFWTVKPSILAVQRRPTTVDPQVGISTKEMMLEWEVT